MWLFRLYKFWQDKNSTYQRINHIVTTISRRKVEEKLYPLYQVHWQQYMHVLKPHTQLIFDSFSYRKCCLTFRNSFAMDINRYYVNKRYETVNLRLIRGFPIDLEPLQHLCKTETWFYQTTIIVFWWPNVATLCSSRLLSQDITDTYKRALGKV